MHQGENIEGLVAPVVGVKELGLELGPVDAQDPGVAADEPDEEEGGEQEVGDSAGGRESWGHTALLPPLKPSRPHLSPDHPQHLDGPEGPSDDHVYWDPWLLRAVSHELDT